MFPISGWEDVAAIVGVLAAIYGVVKGTLAVVKRWRTKRAAAADEMHEFEVHPFWFRVSLNQEIPEVSLQAYVTNLLKKPLTNTVIHVVYLQLEDGPSLDDFKSIATTFPPSQTTVISCRRRLIDSEIRALSRLESRPPFRANLLVRGKGYVGSKEVESQTCHFDGSSWGDVIGIPLKPEVAELLGEINRATKRASG